MRKIAAWLIAGSLVVGVPARAGADKNAPKSPVAREQAKTAEPARTAAAASRAPSSLELQLQQLKEIVEAQARELDAQRALLREQQRQMETMERQIKQQAAGERTAQQQPSDVRVMEAQLEAVADNQRELGQRVGKVEKDEADTKKSLEGKMKGFGPFAFSGDLRVRYEPFFGGGVSTSPAPADRHRARVHLRFNANAKFNDEVSGGLTIASGDPGDPISTNQTLTSFFQRKPFLIDKAFFNYNPSWLKPFQVTAGKWAYTWYRTELTWDNDLNPEGVSEAVSFNWKDSVLQRLSFVAFQMPFNEVSGAPDSGIFGGQIQTGWKLQDRVKFGGYVAYYHYRNPDAIAANQVGNGSTGTTGLLTGNNDTNVFGLIGGNRVFASKFGILDAIARSDIDTGIGRFPLTLLFDFAQNTQACGNLGAFAAAGVTPPACNPRDRQAYWAEVQFGRTQEQGDMRFGYTFIRIEREAVVSAFNFSDLRQGTNIANHRLEYAYQAYKNVNLGFTAFIGRQLVTGTAAKERLLKRLQFDLIYKF
jgi:hypothetical protein